MLTQVLSAHFTDIDLQKLDELVGCHPRATRHAVHRLAFRTGLARLTAADIKADSEKRRTRARRPEVDPT